MTYWICGLRPPRPPKAASFMIILKMFLEITKYNIYTSSALLNIKEILRAPYDRSPDFSIFWYTTISFDFERNNLKENNSISPSQATENFQYSYELPTVVLRNINKSYKLLTSLSGFLNLLPFYERPEIFKIFSRAELVGI